MSEIKLCPRCSREVTNRRKKYCSDACKYWFNMIKKDKEAHLPPVRKRTKNYFSMVTGSKWANNGRQGKRYGSMVVGAMSAMIRETVEEIVEVNQENLQRHFKGIPGYIPLGIKTGDGQFIKKNDIQKEYGIVI